MRTLLFLCSILISLSSFALTLKSNAPKRYEVQHGDTLWLIANRYLEHPWEWRALWQANPKIKNPNLIYPGAILELAYTNQKPYIRVLSNGTIKLSPHVRVSANDDPVPPIPLADIKPFLNASLVLNSNLLRNAAFVVGFTGEHLIGGQGDEVYVKNLYPPKNLPEGTTVSYAIYRPSGKLYDSKTKEFLGYNATLVGNAEYLRGTDPATVILTDITEGIRLEDRLLPNTHPEFDFNFLPQTPLSKVEGSIINLLGDFTRGSVGLVAVLDRGRNANLHPGDVLAIYKRGHVIQNPHNPKDCIHIPSERIGEVMIFRTFSRTSFALVMRSIGEVKPKDLISNP